MRKYMSVILVMSIFWISAMMYAEKKGADIIIQKTDGQKEEGELIAVKEGSLLLKESKSGTDLSVSLNEVKIIKIPKGSNALIGSVIGVTIGAAGGMLIGNEISKSTWLCDSGIVIIAMIGGFGGLLSGALIGSNINRYDTFQIAGRSDAAIKATLADISKKARVPDFQ